MSKKKKRKNPFKTIRFVVGVDVFAHKPVVAIHTLKDDGK